MKLSISAAAALIAALLLTGAAFAHGMTSSLYERNARAARLTTQGCSAAQGHERGVIVLDFGKPAYGHGSYGTIDFSNRFISNRAITRGMLAFARGYVHCLAKHSQAVVTLARGTSNYHPYVPSTRVAGKRWAGQVLALGRKLHENGLSAHVKSAAANDAEPAWDSSFHQTRSFISGFRKWAHGRVLYDYGSLDGGVGSIWTARQIMYVVGGAGRTAVLPEIYYPSQAQQWAELAYIAHSQFHRSVHFAGVMTQGSSDCDCGFRPHAARQALVHAIANWGGGVTPVPQSATNIVSAP